MCRATDNGYIMKDGTKITFADVIIPKGYEDELEQAGELSTFNLGRLIYRRIDPLATIAMVDEKIEANNKKRNSNIALIASLMVAFVTIVSGILLLTK